jgi:hypothetical protein
MDNFWEKAEEFWNHNRVLAWILPLTGIAMTLWASFKPQTPGISIGLLALAAGIMSVRPQMHSAEKFAWVMILIAFAVLEVYAINRTEADNKTTREAQNVAFNNIAAGLKTSLETAKSQYEATIGHVDNVLKTTNEVSVLAKKNLENITGGNSYAYVYPKFLIGQSEGQLAIHNEGRQILSGVTVKISQVTSGSFGLKPVYPIHTIARPRLDVGTLPPHEGRLMEDSITPVFGSDETAYYHIYINAQNAGAAEDMYFQKSKDGSGIAYRLTVIAPATGKRMKGDIFDGKSWVRYVKKTDWIEPTKVPQ